MATDFPLARGLGFAGLIPFYGLALALWLGPTAWSEPAVRALLTYSAVILSFMGAVHWGLAMRVEGTRQLALSVVPALAGWFALALPDVWAVAMFILAFIVLYAGDRYAVQAGLAPASYLDLRWPLTVLVSVSLVIALVELLLRG